MMGYNTANASADIAMSGFGGIGAIASVQDIVTITRTVRPAMVSLSVSFASWEKSVEGQQQLLAGKAFKSIPIQPANLAFVQEAKRPPKLVSLFYWSKLTILCRGDAPLCIHESQEKSDARDSVSDVWRQAWREMRTRHRPAAHGDSSRPSSGSEGRRIIPPEFQIGFEPCVATSTAKTVAALRTLPATGMRASETAGCCSASPLKRVLTVWSFSTSFSIASKGMSTPLLGET